MCIMIIVKISPVQSTRYIVINNDITIIITMWTSNYDNQLLIILTYLLWQARVH